MKAILWDLDGVLVNTADWHYHALNKALEESGQPQISRFLHLAEFDGLPTKIKLEKLRIANKELYQRINSAKQSATWTQIMNECKPDVSRITLLKELSEKHVMGCVTNCIELTANLMLRYSGLDRFMKVLVSNENTTRPKPNSDPFIIAMYCLGVKPDETLAVEDNENGIEAAKTAGCHVWVLKSYEDIEKIKEIL